MNRNIKKFIWYPKKIPELLVPVITPYIDIFQELGTIPDVPFHIVDVCEPTGRIDYHYKNTGKKAYEYAYVGTRGYEKSIQEDHKIYTG